MRTCVAAVVICVSVAGSCQARAGASDSVALTLVGAIERSCSITVPDRALDLGDVSTAGGTQVAIALNCNAPFNVRMASDGGALADTASLVAPGFDTSIPYTASLAVSLDSGGTAESGPCDSGSLFARAPCASVSSGTSTAIGQTATLSLSWQSAAPGSPRLAGTYQDVIRASVEFAP